MSTPSGCPAACPRRGPPYLMTCRRQCMKVGEGRGMPVGGRLAKSAAVATKHGHVSCWRQGGYCGLGRELASHKACGQAGRQAGSTECLPIVEADA